MVVTVTSPAVTLPSAPTPFPRPARSVRNVTPFTVESALPKTSTAMTVEPGSRPRSSGPANSVTDPVITSKAEAKFGNTELPLWIVYGSGGGVEYLGQKDDFIAAQKDELIKSSPAKKLDQPYLVIRIEKAKSSASTFDLSGHNVTEVYLMSGIDESKQMPKYLVLNLTTVSGSNFSMKAEVEKEVTKEW